MTAIQEVAYPPRHAKPGPRGAPIVGVAHELRKDPLNYFVGLMRTYGEFVHFKIGMAPIIMLNSPDAIKHVLQDKFEDYPKSRFYRTFKPILGRSMFTSSGETWLSQRRTATPCFGGARFEIMAERIVAATDKMLDRWDGLDRKGEPVEIVHEMMRLTLDGVTQALLEMDFIENYDELHEALTVILHETERRIWAVVPPPEWFALLTRPRYRRAIKTIDRIIRGIIDERRRNPRNSDGLLSTLIEAHDREGSGDESLLKDQVVAMIATGHESTACALAWAFYTITQHGDVRDRVYEEVDRVLGGRDPRAADLPSLQYTGMVFEESMRLYPPVWTISRVATRDDEIAGVKIPKGTTVMLSPYAMHRNPEFWPEPEKFDPERFHPDEVAKRPRHAYFPFGGGPRVCLGNRFAMMEAKIMIAKVIQRYRLSVLPGQDIVAEPMITLRPRDGIAMALERR
ncbi:MAG: cytochrome P450 [Alphaproteobacteria bacterium]|nr:cytochrome P450 [Alphaproteobacteria bacterium]